MVFGNQERRLEQPANNARIAPSGAILPSIYSKVNGRVRKSKEKEEEERKIRR